MPRESQSPGVTKPLSLNRNTHSRRCRLTQPQKYTPSHTHTHSHKIFHTQTDTEQYTVTYRETDTHSCTRAPGDVEQWAHCLGWQQLGRKEPQCGLWTQAVDCCTPLFAPCIVLSLFFLSEARFCWALDLLREGAPVMSGAGCRGSFLDQAPSGALGTQDPLALMLLPPS